MYVIVLFNTWILFRELFISQTEEYMHEMIKVTEKANKTYLHTSLL